MDKEIMTVQEFAKKLNIKEHVVRRLLKERKLVFLCQEIMHISITHCL